MSDETKKTTGADKAPVVSPEEKAALEAQAKAEDKAQAKAQAKAEKTLKPFSHNGNKYGFNKHTPAKLSIDGKLFTQDELLNNKELMTSLIVGGSAFIKRII